MIPDLNDKLNTGECPVCNRQFGKDSKRQAVLFHIRHMNDDSHTAFRSEHPFKRGRRTNEERIKKLLKSWPEDKIIHLLKQYSTSR